MNRLLFTLTVVVPMAAHGEYFTTLDSERLIYKQVYDVLCSYSGTSLNPHKLSKPNSDHTMHKFGVAVHVR